MKEVTEMSNNLAMSIKNDKEPDDITTYGEYTVKSYFVGDEDITELILSYIDRVASLKL